MVKFIFTGLVSWLFSVLLLLLVIYAMLYYGVGDPIKAMFAQATGDVIIDAERIEAIRESMGLNRPFLVQFGEYVSKLFRGDFGNSYVHGRSVAAMLQSAAPVTIQIALFGLTIAAILGVSFGLIAGLNKGTWIDNILLGISTAIWSIPTFVMAPLLMVLFVLILKIMPVPTGWDGLFSYKAILPLIVVSIRPLAIIIRTTRVSVCDILSEDFIRTARAKGIPEVQVNFKHILRPALTPVVTSLGGLMAYLIQGALLLEIVFGIPGLGRLIFESIKTSDYTILLGSVVITLSLVMITMLIVEVLYPIIDPRIRGTKKERKA